MLPEEERSPRNSDDFTELGERRFVRGLLPVKVAGRGEFRYGIWLELAPDLFRAVIAAWNDDETYAQLRFGATIANAAPPWHKAILGAAVEVGVRDANDRPYVTGSPVPWLQQLLEQGWTEEEYRAAVASFQPQR